MDKLTERMLEVLVRNSKVSFNDLWRAARCSRTRAAEIRNQMLRDGHIISAPVSKGASRLHTITEKGKAAYFKAISSQSTELLASLRGLVGEVAANPRKIDALCASMEAQDHVDDEWLLAESKKEHPALERVSVTDPSGKESQLEGYVSTFIERKQQRAQNDVIRKSIEVLCSMILQVNRSRALQAHNGEIGFVFDQRDGNLVFKELRLLSTRRNQLIHQTPQDHSNAVYAEFVRRNPEVAERFQAWFEERKKLDRLNPI